MKTVFAILAALLVIGPAAFASPTTCPNAQLNTYLAPSFSCSLGNLLFSNFGYTATATAPFVGIPATNVNVTPQTTPADEGFQFNGAFGVTSNNGASFSQNSIITFTVSTLNGLATIDDLGLFFNGAAGGTGSTSVNEQFCLNGAIATCPNVLQSLKVSNPPPAFTNSTFFAPVSTIGISKSINVTSGTNGTAVVSQVVNLYSQTSPVPEPVSYVMLGSGLLGLGLLRKRLRRS